MSGKETETTKPHAALIRDNEQLRNVAAAAIKLRRIGQLADVYHENLQAFWDENSQITRSGTGGIMYAQAYETAFNAFDQTVLEAASRGMEWAQDHKIETKAVQP